MRTFEELQTRALNMSKRAQADATATSEELVDVLNSRLHLAFDKGREANPFAFLAVKRVPIASEGWPRPMDAHTVLRIELNSEEVALVPFDQQGIEKAPGKMSVYRVGNTYMPVDVDDSTSDAELKFWYSRLPQEFPPDAPQAELDELYPHGHERLLALGMASYLAKKDGRHEDAQVFDAEIAMETARFMKALAAQDVNARRLGGP